ncbi:MAG: hypothetical protein GY701_17190 [Sulfitobacter sp.]|nr:hypothetical protein [Sulfitobacter sp.]
MSPPTPALGRFPGFGAPVDAVYETWRKNDSRAMQQMIAPATKPNKVSIKINVLLRRC